MMPVAGLVTFPSLIMISTTAFTVSIGIANPIPVFCSSESDRAFMTECKPFDVIDIADWVWLVPICHVIQCSPADAPDVDKIAVFMPITAPDESSKGPPELPGLIAASVCIMLYIGFLLGDATCLPNPLTIPVVNVWSKPNGFPIAMAN
jgi:hypothetical protein